jgi:hypothetical protein
MGHRGLRHVADWLLTVAARRLPLASPRRLPRYGWPRDLRRILEETAADEVNACPEGLFSRDVHAAVATATHWLDEAGSLAEQMR